MSILKVGCGDKLIFPGFSACGEVHCGTRRDGGSVPWLSASATGVRALQCGVSSALGGQQAPVREIVGRGVR